MGLIASALKRQQAKESNKIKNNKKTMKNNESDDSSASSGSVSIYNLEGPIPRKQKAFNKLVNKSLGINKKKRREKVLQVDRRGN